MKRGDIIRVTIEGIAPDGTGLAVAEGRKMRVTGALPGDEVDVRVAAVKRHTARVKLESIVVHGVERIPAECPHFKQCGGCQWQDISYDIQCRLKSQLVHAALNKIAGIEPIEHVEVVPSPDMFFYRNKMEFSFDSPPALEGKVLLGLHEAGRYDRVFDLKRCFLQSELSNKAVNVARMCAAELGLTAYGLKSHTGLLRFLMFRDGKNTGDIMINLVTSGEEFDTAAEYADLITREIPEITTVIRSINRSKGSVAIGEEQEVLYGDGFIRDRIGDCTFTISSDSFFQTNPHQAENLYGTIKDFSRLSGKEHLLDLYCGIGTIGIYLAERTERVIGVEVVESAVEDAKRNATLNGIENITFLAGKVEKVVDEAIGQFDVVVCDPPRAGVHPKALNHLLRMRIPRMVYVSCNVRAMSYDLEMLSMAGYRIREVRAFDMSPHTPHIETVVLMEIEK